MTPFLFALLMGALGVADAVAVALPKETDHRATMTVGPSLQFHSNLMRTVGGPGERVTISADAQVSASLLRDSSSTFTATTTTFLFSPSSATYTEHSASLCTMNPNGGDHSAYCVRPAAGSKVDCLNVCKGLMWYECTAAVYNPDGDVCTLYVDDATVQAFNSAGTQTSHECPQDYTPNDASVNFLHPHIATWTAILDDSSACKSLGLCSVCYIQNDPPVLTGQWPGTWKMLTAEQDFGNTVNQLFGGTGCNPTSPTDQQTSAMLATLWECENKCLNEANSCNAINVELLDDADPSTLKCRYFTCSDVMNPTYTGPSDVLPGRKAYIYRPE